MTAKVKPEQFEDPMWRIHNLYTIIDKYGQRQPFRPNRAQEDFLQHMHHRNVILKARQLGFTTLMGIVQLDDCLFSPDTRAAIIAHRLDDAKVIFRDKVKFVYDSLDEGLRNAVGAKQDSADTLTLTNNSSFRVSTSTRSGTLQWLHISEYGKICAQFPDKAREIKTGAFPSAEKGIITIESTAEGSEGDFYDKCMDAIGHHNRESELSPKEFKFFFYPWYSEPNYSQKQSVVPISPADEVYFERSERDIREWTGDPDFELTEEQKNWWVAEENNLGGDMKREYPATPREAFEQAIEGAYFADQLASAEKHGRIGIYGIDPAYPVNTFWDLGRSDSTCIWMEQDRDGYATFVGYYENQEEWIGHYIQWLKDWAAEHEVSFGDHYMPHDGDRQSLWMPEGTMSVMARMNFRPKIVPVVKNKMEAIQLARRRFFECRFDEKNTKNGLSRLRMYRKDWNKRLGTWSEKPRHDMNSHGADAFMTFTSSPHKVRNQYEKAQDRYRRKRRDSYSGSFMSA